MLRLAFREELKDNARARHAWEMDVLSLLPQQLGRDYPEFELSNTMRERADRLRAVISALDTRIKEAQTQRIVALARHRLA